MDLTVPVFMQPKWGIYEQMLYDMGIYIYHGHLMGI